MQKKEKVVVIIVVKLPLQSFAEKKGTLSMLFVFHILDRPLMRACPLWRGRR